MQQLGLTAGDTTADQRDLAATTTALGVQPPERGKFLSSFDQRHAPAPSPPALGSGPAPPRPKSRSVIGVFPVAPRSAVNLTAITTVVEGLPIGWMNNA
ncbi:hypothetical protein Aglo01_05300 [Actinokineospora globicatena]|nr:hypothetical protein Aglo01_05300 [Actinokineospora globicatena]